MRFEMIDVRTVNAKRQTTLYPVFQNRIIKKIHG